MTRLVDLERLCHLLPEEVPLSVRGRLVELTGPVARAEVAGARQGELVRIRRDGLPDVVAEVVGFRGVEAILLPIGDMRGVAAGAEVEMGGMPLTIRVGRQLLGQVIDALGRPIDGGRLPAGLVSWPVDRPAPAPLDRPRITRPLALGIRALDALLTMGEGQRLGLFAGSGVGKSTLLGQIARGSSADVVVVGLVGERGREVREFLETCLGGAVRARSVVVVATSDEPALVRLRAAQAATAVAEWFAEAQGASVLLLVDSVTRFARAQREVGLSAGEPPGRQGYPSSVFAELPRLLERAGTRVRGCITAIYTVLVPGDDLDEPVADEVRSILDGHVVLDRRVAAAGRFPAVDVLRSVSRVMREIVGKPQASAAARLRGLLAAWERHRDLIELGAYVHGSDPATDEAVARIEGIERFLSQRPEEITTLEEAVSGLLRVLS